MLPFVVCYLCYASLRRLESGLVGWSGGEGLECLPCWMMGSPSSVDDVVQQQSFEPGSVLAHSCRGVV